MKIDKTSKPLSPSTAGEASSRNSATKANNNQAATETSGTSVHLGSTTAQLLSLGGSVASTPLVDVQKVADIKQAISEGRFKVNSGVVADRLINSVQDLITASKH